MWRPRRRPTWRLLACLLVMYFIVQVFSLWGVTRKEKEMGRQQQGQRDAFLDELLGMVAHVKEDTEAPTTVKLRDSWTEWRSKRTFSSENGVIGMSLGKLGYHKVAAEHDDDTRPFWHVAEMECRDDVSLGTIQSCPWTQAMSNAAMDAALKNDWTFKCLKTDTFVPVTRVMTKQTDLTRMWGGDNESPQEQKSCFFVKRHKAVVAVMNGDDDATFPLPICGTQADVMSVLRGLQREHKFQGIVMQDDVTNLLLWDAHKFSIRMWAVVVVSSGVSTTYVHDDAVIYRSLEPFHNHDAPPLMRFFSQVPTKQRAHPDFATRGASHAFACLNDLQSYLNSQLGPSSEIGMYVAKILPPHLTRLVTALVHTVTVAAAKPTPRNNNNSTLVHQICFDFVLDKSWQVWLVGFGAECPLPPSSVKLACADKIRDSMSIQSIRVAEHVARYHKPWPGKKVGALVKVAAGDVCSSSGTTIYERFVARRHLMTSRVASLIHPNGLATSNLFHTDEQPSSSSSRVPCPRCGYVNGVGSTHCDACALALFNEVVVNTNHHDSSFRVRLVDILTKYDPDRISTIDTLLERFHGREEMLIQKLEAQYAAHVDNNNMMDKNNNDEFRERIIEILGRHAPQELSEVDGLLDRFHGKEAQLVEQLQVRFGKDEG